MVATLLIGSEETRRINELLRPDVLVGGHQPEAREVCHALSWERYLALDQAFGDDRSGPLFCYLDGILEIMTTSGEHERIKRWLNTCMDLYFGERGIRVSPRGQATMRLALKQAGAEPDESWCIGGEKEFPDLVLEVALTSGGIIKLDLYQRFAVPEVWIWRRDRLEMFGLRADGSGYDQLTTGSRLLPELNVHLLERCVGIADWLEARQTFLVGLAAGK